jgi:hypothetical protein
MNLKTKLLGPLFLLPLLLGCTGPSQTIRQLGHPTFEVVVGKGTLYTRPDPEQRQGMDAYTSESKGNADHTFMISFWPTGNEDTISLEIRARANGKLQLESLAAAAFPLTRQQAQRFKVMGELPQTDQRGAPAAPIALETRSEFTESGTTILYLTVPRSASPAGTEWLAVPTLAKFKDEWISVRFYETAVPQHMKLQVLPPGAVPVKKGESSDDPDAKATPPSNG